MAIFGSVTRKCDAAFDHLWKILDYYDCHLSVSPKSFHPISTEGSKIILIKSPIIKMVEYLTWGELSRGDIFLGELGCCKTKRTL